MVDLFSRGYTFGPIRGVHFHSGFGGTLSKQFKFGGTLSIRGYTFYGKHGTSKIADSV